MDFYLKNEKGLFSTPFSLAVVTAAGVQHLKKVRGTMPAEDQKILDRALNLLENLAIKPHNYFIGKPYIFGINDKIPPGNKDGVAHDIDCHVWMAPSNFQSKSGGTFPSKDPQELGWLAILDLSQPSFQKKWVDLFSRHAVSVSCHAFGQINHLKKRHTWAFFESDASLIYSEGNACALYSEKGGGYLNDKGSFAPLAGARLFESLEAARRTSVSRGIQDAVFAHVECRVVAVDRTHAPATGLGKLGGVMARLEAESLTKSLTMETSPSTPRRRM